MELSGTQCEVAANLIPVLLLAFTLQNRGDGRHLFAMFKVLNSIALVGLVVAWAIAFVGIDRGLGWVAGTYVWNMLLGGVALCAATMISLYLVPQPESRRERSNRQD
ncbi:hypothetical protein ACLM5J_09740 [Nocardioides sp. Bht2]|uniref:hypothetical protein n=1 Tax=Nocardioides sp. Bht2 TaxID=3392297 RepID=UPI0039B4DA9B